MVEPTAPCGSGRSAASTPSVERFYRERFNPTLEPLLDLDFDRVLVTHGQPVMDDGPAELAKALRAGRFTTTPSLSGRAAGAAGYPNAGSSRPGNSSGSPSLTRSLNSAGRFSRNDMTPSRASAD